MYYRYQIINYVNAIVMLNLFQHLNILITDMKIRKFIQTTGLASATMMLLKFLKAQEKNTTINSEKILVIVQLTSGNDGLNTVVPFENDLYNNARPTISIQKNEVL